MRNACDLGIMLYVHHAVKLTWPLGRRRTARPLSSQRRPQILWTCRFKLDLSRLAYITSASVQSPRILKNPTFFKIYCSDFKKKLLFSFQDFFFMNKPLFLSALLLILPVVFAFYVKSLAFKPSIISYVPNVFFCKKKENE